MGWTYVENPLRFGSEKSKNFFSGTARNVYNLSTSESKGSALKTSLSFEIREEAAILPLGRLAPPLIIVGSDEEVPGVMEGRLPNSVEEKAIRLNPSTTLYLENIKIVMTQDIENAILEDCRKFRTDKFGEETAKSSSDVYISERRLVCAFHNGMTAISDNTFLNSCNLTMKEPTELVHPGSFSVSNVFVDSNTCLVLQLDIVVRIPFGVTGEESKTVTVGWVPFFLEEDMAGQITSLQTDLLTGPAKSLSMKTVFELKQKNESTALFLTAGLNLSNSMSKPPAFYSSSSLIGGQGPQNEMIS